MSKLNPKSAVVFIIAFDICCTPIDIEGLLLLLLLLLVLLLLLLLFAAPIIVFCPPIGLCTGRTLFNCVRPLTTARSSWRTNSDEFIVGLLTPFVRERMRIENGNVFSMADDDLLFGSVNRTENFSIKSLLCNGRWLNDFFLCDWLM